MRYLIGLLLGIVAYAVTERRTVNRLHTQQEMIARLEAANGVMMDAIDEVLFWRNLPPAPDCDDDRLGPFEDWLNRREEGE